MLQLILDAATSKEKWFWKNQLRISPDFLQRLFARSSNAHTESEPTPYKLSSEINSQQSVGLIDFKQWWTTRLSALCSTTNCKKILTLHYFYWKLPYAPLYPNFPQAWGTIHRFYPVLGTQPVSTVKYNSNFNEAEQHYPEVWGMKWKRKIHINWAKGQPFLGKEMHSFGRIQIAFFSLSIHRQYLRFLTSREVQKSKILHFLLQKWHIYPQNSSYGTSKTESHSFME